jgi:hypothetical protein
MAALALLFALQDPELQIAADFTWGLQYRENAPSPVKIQFDNPGPTARGRLVLKWDGGEDSTWETDLVLPEKSRQLHTFVVRGADYPRAVLKVAFQPDGKKKPITAQAAGVQVGPNELFLGVVGETGAPMLREAWDPRPAVGFSRPADLPDRWIGYSCLDVLLWLDADPARIRDPSQIAALRLWIAQGGHLIVCRGQAAGLKGTVLEELLPAEISGDGLEAIPSTIGNRPAPEGKAPLLHLSPRSGARVVLGADARPLAVQGTLGRGRVTLVGFDVLKEPFLSWGQMGRIWTTLIRFRPPQVDERNIDSALLAMGSGKLISLGRQFPNADPPAIGWAFLFILALVFLVGPVDYFVLRRLNRFEWTWVTFPSIVIAASAVALLAGGTLPAGTVLAREMAVVDYYPDARVERGWSILSLLTIGKGRYDVKTARPGGDLRPLDSSMYGFGRFTGEEAAVPIRFSPVEPAAVKDWTLPRGSTGVMLAQWCAPSKRGVTFEAEGDTLSFDNPFDEPVRHAILVSPRGVYDVGTIPPGKSRRSYEIAYRNWVEGVRQNSDAQLPGVNEYDGDPWRRSYYVEGPVVTDADKLESSIRLALVGLSFHESLRETGVVAPGARMTGMAREWESSGAVVSGGSVLLGFLRRSAAMKLSPSVWTSNDTVLIRTFKKND